MELLLQEGHSREVYTVAFNTDRWDLHSDDSGRSYSGNLLPRLGH